jgi:hypothetical protein
MPASKFDQIRDGLVERYKAEQRIEVLGEEFGVSRATIFNYLNKLSIYEGRAGTAHESQVDTCPVCQKEFEQPYNYKRKTCSRACGQALVKDQKRKGVTCLQCGKRYTVRPSEKSNLSYCSRECYGKSKTKQASVERECFYCGEKFNSFKSSGQRFCSQKCGAQARRIELHFCPCGNNSVKNRQSKYCSDECRNKYGKTKTGQPPVVKICLGCNEEFSRPWYYSGKMLYCSNECAKREQKKGWSKRAVELDDGSLLILRSLYELRFIACCERFDIPWRSYDGPSIETPVGNYRPDFIVNINDEEYIIEVKGHITEDAKIKIAIAKDTIPNFRVWAKELLEWTENNGF